MYKSYGELSTAVYEKTKPIGSSINGDIPYYISRLQHVTSPILEPASGTGRMLFPLIDAGFQVVGVDTSKEMLDLCRSYATNNGYNPTLIQDDITTVQLHQKFGAIIVPTGSFSLLTSRELAKTALQNFYHHLEEGGKLILDIIAPGPIEDDRTVSHFHLSEETGIRMTSMLLSNNWIEQTFTKEIVYEKWTNGEKTDTELQTLAIRWYGVEEFRSFLNEVGFTNIVVSSDYTYQQPAHQGATSITFEATK
ncbi:class I SAM-dependent methyltransferase [Geomicrobium sp. JCM 19038]|uniref:class I SAM-dependent methyltransferase n=1 Tax=Geomicrobium sp. JCM 19038 TaxID=1460635 RepID=UPI00045F49E5|nr:class I SAM-dependent methyltransferase [Geomicrobium sp. JCM 19038]GAK08706.1 methyltransferase [Geomicrobium sp. JCM 19038]